MSANVHLIRMLNELGYLYSTLPDDKTAATNFAEALAMAKKLDPDSLEAFFSMRGLAAIAVNRGKYDEACSLLEEAFASGKRARGSSHPDTLITQNALAIAYGDLGQDEKAEALFLDEIRLLKATAGEHDPTLAQAMNSLAGNYLRWGKYEKAEPLLVSALEIRTLTFGREDFATSTTLNNLASLYMLQGRFDNAEPLFLEAVAIRKRLLGDDDPATATALNNLAGLYNRKGEFAKAESTYRLALTRYFVEKCSAIVNPITATTIGNLKRGVSQSQPYGRSGTSFQGVDGDDSLAARRGASRNCPLVYQQQRLLLCHIYETAKSLCQGCTWKACTKGA